MSDAQHVQFTGSIPAIYDRYLGPVLFEPFARDLAKRLPTHEQVELRLADALRRELGDRPMRVHLQSWLVTATT